MRKSQLEDHARSSSGGSNGFGGYSNLMKVENDLNKRDLEDVKVKTSDCILYLQTMDERMTSLERKMCLMSKSVEERLETLQASIFAIENSSRVSKVCTIYLYNHLLFIIYISMLLLLYLLDLYCIGWCTRIRK